MTFFVQSFFIFAALGLSACGPARFDSDAFSLESLTAESSPTAIEEIAAEGAPNGFDEIESSVDTIQKVCQNRPKKQKIQKVVYNPPGQTCDWGGSGNGLPINNFLQARIEQKIQLDIPDGAIPCDLKLNFPEQNFRYDDHFLLSFNRSVIASSYNFSGILEETTANLLAYDWTKILGQEWDSNREEIYCAQADGRRSCVFPGHDEEGALDIELSETFVIESLAGGAPLQKSYFQMTTIGDNDLLDCEHTGIEFDVEMEYVE